ncbi:MAG: hypothetical protein AAF449_06030 [Myxococcota bacterium]
MDRVDVMLDHVIDTSQKKTHYKVESYFFIPRSLGLTRHTYSINDFFTDVSSYIRFQEPTISDKILADINNENSPLHRALKWIDKETQISTTTTKSRLSYEMRMFACIVGTNLRDIAIDLKKKIRRLDIKSVDSVLMSDVEHGTTALIESMRLQLSALRSVRAIFNRTDSPRWHRELFAYTDRYMSVAAEECLTSVVIGFDTAPAAIHCRLTALKKAVVEGLVEEQCYQKSVDYQTVESTPRQNASFVYQLSVLRKYVRSVLFLEVERSEERRRKRRLFSGIAASIAAAFSAVLAVWARIVYDIDSFSFLVVIGLGYFCRLQIWQWLRRAFKRLDHRFYDIRRKIREPHTRRYLGVCRESFRFVPMTEVPSEVIHYRHQGSSMIERERNSEVVIKYVKDVTLLGAKIAAFRRGFKSIVDIHRFNISRLLIWMNEPEEYVASYDTALNRTVGVSCPKNYNINLVISRTGDRSKTVDRYRLILDKSGLTSLQFIKTDRSSHSVHEHAELGD